eukprot:COSAG01_NODE_70062_length_259_cov_1.593750_1_plen_21_part_01
MTFKLSQASSLQATAMSSSAT